ncbi:MAG: biopolymer transporter ExbD [Planctomycetota bacterium]
MSSQLPHLDEVLEEHDEAEPSTKKRREDDEMDITPMIDITFLLLIFFILQSTPDKSTAIQLPDASNGAPVSQMESTVFTIGDSGAESNPVYNADGKIEAFRLPDDPKEQAEAIRAAVEEGLAAEGKSDVIIKADKAVKCRAVQSVMKAASKVKGVKLHLAVLTPK